MSSTSSRTRISKQMSAKKVVQNILETLEVPIGMKPLIQIQRLLDSQLDFKHDFSFLILRREQLATKVYMTLPCKLVCRVHRVTREVILHCTNNDSRLVQTKHCLVSALFHREKLTFPYNITLISICHPSFLNYSAVQKFKTTINKLTQMEIIYYIL